VCPPVSPISSIDMRHITNGDFLNNGRFGGWHSRYSGNPNNLRVRKISKQRNSQGVYEGVVQYRGPRGNWKTKKDNGGKSTFFPDKWSPQVIDAEIRSAHIDAINRGQTGGGVVRGKSSSGIEIEMILRREGNSGFVVRSEYPIMK